MFIFDLNEFDWFYIQLHVFPFFLAEYRNINLQTIFLCFYSFMFL